MVKKEYIVAVASRLKVLSPDLYYDDTSDTSDPPAVRVIHSVISQALNYETTVYPRLVDFKKNCPDVKSVRQLADLMASYTTPRFS